MRQITTLIKMILPILAIAAAAVLVVSAEAAPFGTPPATAAPAKPSTISGGLFAGTFEGYLTGDQDSRAPMTLELSQRDNIVTGDIVIGKGLVVDGGVCGLAAVPAGTQSAGGQVSTRNTRHLDAGTKLEVQGMTIKIDLDGDLSRDGQTLSAVAKIDLPWLCGRDPLVSGALERVS